MSPQIHRDKSLLYNQAENTTEQVNLEFEILLDYLKHSRGRDLTSYKRPSLMRRFQHRMQSINIDTYQSYLKYLQSHPEEYLTLQQEVLVNVSSFFRDHDAWNYLAAKIIPQIIASKQPDKPIRVWSAGCAAGQEICSLLILLAEALGIESCSQRVQCYATDADESALVRARQVTYSQSEITDIPPDWQKKYFQQTEKGYVFHPQLRRTIIFSRHDLTQNSPLANIDLLTCRNVLIYLNLETQASILVRFHFALKNTGFLFLGQAETLINRRQIFTPVSLNYRIYAKGLKLELNDYLCMLPNSRKKQTANLVSIQNYFWETAFETSSFALLALDANSCLLHANEQARSLFGIRFDDLKRPFHELEPAKFISPHTLKQAIHSDQHLTVLKNVEWTTQKGTKHFNIDILQVMTTKNHLLGVTLTFMETNDCNTLKEELESTRSELAIVSQDLEEKKSELSKAYKELEDTKKELDLLSPKVSSYTNGCHDNSLVTLS